MSRLVLVDHVADAPAAAPDTTTVVLDAAWTPMPGERPDLVAIRPIVQSILDEVDVIDDSLAALDAWAGAAGLPDAFAADGVPWWYRARMLLRWDVHELVLWRLVLDRLADGREHEAISLPTGRPGLLAAARASSPPSDGAAGPTIEVTGRRPPARRFLRRNRRRLSELLARLRPAPRTLSERTATLEGRLDSLAREGGGVLALAWPRAFQVVREGGLERWVDPYLVGALDRISADGERVTTIGLGLDHEDDADWSLIERDAQLLPERFLVERAVSGGDGGEGRAAGDPAGDDARQVTEAIARSAGVPYRLNDLDLGPALADLVAGYAGRWLDRQRSGFRAAQAALLELRPAVLFTDREASRTGWLAAGRLAGVPSVSIQHGMIYPNSPEYFQPLHARRVRPDVTCVFGDYERDLLVGQAGFEPEAVVVTGSPRPLASGDGVESADRDVVRRELGIRAGDRLLLVSVAHNEVLGELHTFGLLERTLGGPLPGIHVVVKLHPQDRGEPRHDALLRGLAAAGGHEAPRVSIVRDLDLYRLLRAADAHLGQYSTVLSDAVVAGTPNMIAVGQAHADALDHVGAGVATPVRTVDEVRAFVADPRPADPAARRRFLDAHYRPGDGAGRLADVLNGVIAGTPAGGEGAAGPGAGQGSGQGAGHDAGAIGATA